MPRYLSRIAAISLILAICLIGVLRQTMAQGGPALTNAGFEGTFLPASNDITRLVASGWTPWSKAPTDADKFLIVPQYRDASTSNVKRIHGGSSAQELFEFYAGFDGGVYQQVTVAAGSKIKFSAFVNVWSTSLDDITKSEQPSRAALQVGIDPKGGTDAESTNVVYSTAQQFYDEYRQLSVEATAAGTTITVFVRISLPDPVRYNRGYIDDAALAVVGAPEPTTAVPTHTLTATSTVLIPTLSPTPSNTPVVTPTATDILGVPTREGGTPGPTEVVTATNTQTPVATSSNPNLTGRINYIVQPGDTVSGLAFRFNSTEEAIIQVNGLNADGLILVGQQLVIPVPEATPTPTLVASTVPPGVPGNAPVLNATLTGPTLFGIGTYIMQPGDTLAAVALRYNVSLGTLAFLNGIVNPNRLVIGQVLVVPGPGNNYPGGTVAPTRYPYVTGVPPVQPRTYVVQPGDNLFRIALKFNVSMVTLMQVNGIYNANYVYVGQTLRIP